jgi:hypothetical protein
MDEFQREIKQWLKDEMKKYDISPKKLKEQEQRIIESRLFILKPSRGGLIPVIKPTKKVK